ncbi:MAG: hypothetical protein A2176_15195, partial [Spirochaetes bacterium RBG_13_51_14]
MSTVERKYSRFKIYHLLSDCYYIPGEHTRGLIEQLNEAMCNLYPDLVKCIPNNIAGIDHQDLLIDFSKLFIGPYQTTSPPYGSIYLENEWKVFSDTTLDAVNRYAEEGLDLAENHIPDHVAVELEFMFYLTKKEYDALMRSDDAEASRCRVKQTQFLEDHIGEWVSKFADLVVKHAR